MGVHIVQRVTPSLLQPSTTHVWASIFRIIHHHHHTIPTQKHLPNVAPLKLLLLVGLPLEVRGDGIPHLLCVLQDHVEVLVKSFHAAVNFFVVAAADQNWLLFLHSVLEEGEGAFIEGLLFDLWVKGEARHHGWGRMWRLRCGGGWK